MDETYQRKQVGVNALAEQVLRVLSVFSLVNKIEGLQVSSSAFSFEFCGLHISNFSCYVICVDNFMDVPDEICTCSDAFQLHQRRNWEWRRNQQPSLEPRFELDGLHVRFHRSDLLCSSRVARHFESSSGSDESETLLQEPDAETEPNEEQTFNGVKFHVFLAACNERSLQL